MIERLNHEPDEQLAEWAHVLYNQAVLTLGARLEDPAAFVAKLNGLLVTLTGEPEDPTGTGARSGQTSGRRRGTGEPGRTGRFGGRA